MIIKTIKCQQCSTVFDVIYKHTVTNSRRFCDTCANARKYQCINESNIGRSKVLVKMSGRPKNVDNFYGKDDIRMTWDEPNYRGY